MAMNFQDSFDRCCRLCAEEQEVTIKIFSAEAEEMLLQNKLNKYLLIEVDENDKLPKNICVRCCSKLESVCDFIDNARKAQEILLDRSIELDQLSTDLPNIKEEIKTETKPYFDEEACITEMEVSVDPMLLLQNRDGTPSSDQEESAQNFEDVTYLHGVDGENVTIKLIKRGDSHDSDNDSLNQLKLGDITKTDDDKKPFHCTICLRRFLCELALKNHTWIHYSEYKKVSENYKCSTCNGSFEYKNDLIAHLKEHRKGTTCKICSRVFRSEYNLAQHMKNHSALVPSFTCKICGRAYNTSSNLRTHSITHSNERPYQCHVCKKSFKRNQDLKFHINQHTGAKPYKCPFCEKSFASSGNCYSHRSRMHPGKRIESKVPRGRRRALPVQREHQPLRSVSSKLPMMNVKGMYRYQCQLCEHSFLKRDNFLYHMYQHTGEKPFHCSYCTEKFVTRRGLLLHHDKEHPSKDRPLALLSKNILLK